MIQIFLSAELPWPENKQIDLPTRYDSGLNGYLGLLHIPGYCDRCETSLQYLFQNTDWSNYSWELKLN